jgi:tyrosine-specific transport protein
MQGRKIKLLPTAQGMFNVFLYFPQDGVSGFLFGESKMKLLGCICLIAGTAIGAGMIALPIALAKFGLIYASLLMLGTCFICYLSALLNIELNLRAGQGLPLGALGTYFSGTKAYIFGSASLLLLCYALVCAYIYGGASTLTSMEGFPLDFKQTACIYTAVIGFVMLWSVEKVDWLNRLLFIGLITVVMVILTMILWHLDFAKLPITSLTSLSLGDTNAVLPIVFTSFGFQVIFHTLTNYTQKDPAILKKAFFWGSLIPAIVYIAWVTAVCGLIYGHNPELFTKMALNGIEVGVMVQALSNISNSGFLNLLTWSISFLAILTSMIGVSLGLIDTLKTKHPILNNHRVAVFAALIPALIVALLVPNAFIKALSFAGMILSFMALLLPLYLLYCANRKDSKTYWYPILKSKIVLLCIAGYGVWVIMSELQNVLAS